MTGALGTIPAELRSMFLPQVEQLGVGAMRQAGCGVVATVDNDLCAGTMWVAPVGRDCLVSAHDLTPKRTFNMTEHPERDFMCVASLSAPAASCLAATRSERLCRPRTSVVAYSQEAGAVHFDMGARSRYRTAAVSFLPGFFTHLADVMPEGCKAPEALFDAGTGAGGHTLDEQGRAGAGLRALLDSLGDGLAAGPAAQLQLHARVTQALALLVEEGHETRQARLAMGATSQQALVRQARALIDAHLGEDLSLERLSRDLLVSRTHLCCAFKQETGTSVGAYIQGRRVELAKRLLAQPGARVQQVARQVGYARQGSFTEMFRKATGMTPVEWRDGKC